MKHLLLTTIAAVLVVGCGESPKEISIHDAAAAGDIEAVKQHLAAGADVNVMDEDGWIPLHYATANDHKELAELLIAKGANVNAKSDEGGTPLHYAAIKGHKELAELLIANGADVNAKIEKTGVEVGLTSTEIVVVMTPLDFAKRKPEIADILRKHGGKTGEELKAEGK